MPNQRNGCAQFAAGKLPEIQLACRPSSVHLPVHPSPSSHTFWPRSLVCLTFQFVGPVRKKRRKEEKAAAAGATVGPKSTTTGAAVPFWLCLYELQLLLLPTPPLLSRCTTASYCSAIHHTPLRPICSAAAASAHIACRERRVHILTPF